LTWTWDQLLTWRPHSEGWGAFKGLLTAQIPSRIRLFQGLRGLGGTDLIVSPIRRMTVSASLSTFRGLAAVNTCAHALQEGFGHTLMSKSSQTSSKPGDARYSKRSLKRGMGLWGAFSVRSALMYFQLQSAILSFWPKHLSKVASYNHQG